jgi:ribosomal protein L11 methylase PrmA
VPDSDRLPPTTVPYRIDLPDPPAHTLDTLINLGALDIEPVAGGLAAVFPDAVPAERVAHALGLRDLQVSTAVGRDDESVWILAPRAVRFRTLVIVPATAPPASGALRLVDGAAFGTGLHATTALCLEAIEDLLDERVPDRVLDVGTGSGVLALVALRRGVRRAVALDLDAGALTVADENARLNDLRDRLLLARGGPEVVRGSWPLVVANIRAAELMAMSSTLARLVASRGRLILSGVPVSVAADVRHVYQRLGMSLLTLPERDGWTALVFHPSW